MSNLPPTVPSPTASPILLSIHLWTSDLPRMLSAIVFFFPSHTFPGYPPPIQLPVWPQANRPKCRHQLSTLSQRQAPHATERGGFMTTSLPTSQNGGQHLTSCSLNSTSSGKKATVLCPSSLSHIPTSDTRQTLVTPPQHSFSPLLSISTHLRPAKPDWGTHQVLPRPLEDPSSYPKALSLLLSDSPIRNLVTIVSTAFQRL